MPQVSRALNSLVVFFFLDLNRLLNNNQIKQIVRRSFEDLENLKYL